MTYDEQPPQLRAAVTSLLHSDFSRRQDVTNWTRIDFLHSAGSIPGALVYAALFAPSFVEIEGLVFLADLGPDSEDFPQIAANVRAARAKSDRDLEQLLKGYNWIEVPFLFMDRRGSEVEEATLAQVVADAWRARLKGLYPNRSFEVRVLPESETGGWVGVGFTESFA